MDKKLVKEFCGITDIGTNRVTNEDVFASLVECGFFALADGMGGHKAGEVAAKEAISFICSSIKHIHTSHDQKNLEQLSLSLKKLFENANDWIYKLSRSHENFFGMGTTLCSLLFFDSKVIFSNVGDSRIYLFRKNELILLTQDHSTIVKNKQNKTKKFLTQVIGSSKVISPQIESLDPEDGDLYLICSDGLSDFIKNEYIQLILKSKFNLEEKTKILIETAKKQGSTDNITVILVQK